MGEVIGRGVGATTRGRLESLAVGLGLASACCSPPAPTAVQTLETVHFAADKPSSTTLASYHPPPAAHAPKQAVAVTPPPTEGATATDCGKQTEARLLTPQLRNGVAGNFVAFELAVRDCRGRPLPLEPAEVLFDFDASMHAPPKLDYTLDGGRGVVRGTFEVVHGADLFGVRRPGRLHYRTHQTAQVDDSGRKVLLRISLNGAHLVPRTRGGEPAESVRTMLRYGDAAVVERRVGLAP